MIYFHLFAPVLKAKENTEADEIMEYATEDIEGHVPKQPHQEQQIRIILEAKELKDFKLIVKPVRLV